MKLHFKNHFFTLIYHRNREVDNYFKNQKEIPMKELVSSLFVKKIDSYLNYKDYFEKTSLCPTLFIKINFVNNPYYQPLQGA